jgi:hypothetical protein
MKATTWLAYAFSAHFRSGGCFAGDAQEFCVVVSEASIHIQPFTSACLTTNTGWKP